MENFISSQAQFRTPGENIEEAKMSSPLQQSIKNKSLLQPQSEFPGLIRKLSQKTTKLDGDEVSFEWPHSKKDLMTVLIKNQ